MECWDRDDDHRTLSSWTSNTSGSLACDSKLRRGPNCSHNQSQAQERSQIVRDSKRRMVILSLLLNRCETDRSRSIYQLARLYLLWYGLQPLVDVAYFWRDQSPPLACKTMEKQKLPVTKTIKLSVNAWNRSIPPAFMPISTSFRPLIIYKKNRFICQEKPWRMWNCLELLSNHLRKGQLPGEILS